MADVTEARNNYNKLCAALNTSQLTGTQKRLSTGLKIEDSTVLAVDGYAIPVRVYTKVCEEQREVVEGIGYYVHGGGWRVGNLDSEDLQCRRLCLDTGLKIVSVDYRLAPENPFPVPVNDVWDVYCRLASSSSPKPLVVIGSSSGGHLAAIAVRKSIYSEGCVTSPVGLVLRCPVTVHPEAVPQRWKEQYGHVGYEGKPESLLLPPGKMRVCYEALAVPEAQRDDPLAYPLYGSFEGFPRTVIQACRQDILLNDAVCFHGALKEANVESKLRIYEQGQHTFWLKFPEAEGTEEVQKDMVMEVLDILEEASKGCN